jgi:hypothetical protein
MMYVTPALPAAMNLPTDMQSTVITTTVLSSSFDVCFMYREISAAVNGKAEKKKRKKNCSSLYPRPDDKAKTQIRRTFGV